MTLPNFIVFGVAKSGTTSIHRYLEQHPEIFMCPIKASNFFGYEDALDWHWKDEGDPPSLAYFHAKTLAEYEALFDGVTNEKAVGEVAPQYFHCPTAAQRIHDTIPNVKLAVSLRNPADRAFSGFLMRTRRGDAVRDYFEELGPESSHVKESFYYRRLKRYFDIFPKEQIKVYIFEEFKQDPSKAMMDLLEFLGVNTSWMPDTSVRYNPGAIPKIRWLNKLFYHRTLIDITQMILPKRLRMMGKRIRERNLRSAPKLPPQLRAELMKLYREDILKVEELIGRDLSIWLREPSRIPS